MRQNKLYSLNGLGRFYLPAILLFSDGWTGETIIHIMWCSRTVILIFRNLKKNPLKRNLFDSNEKRRIFTTTS